jgi:hypothetical protein
MEMAMKDFGSTRRQAFKTIGAAIILGMTAVRRMSRPTHTR